MTVRHLLGGMRPAKRAVHSSGQMFTKGEGRQSLRQSNSTRAVVGGSKARTAPGSRLGMLSSWTQVCAVDGSTAKSMGRQLAWTWPSTTEALCCSCRSYASRSLQLPELSRGVGFTQSVLKLTLHIPHDANRTDWTASELSRHPAAPFAYLGCKAA